MRSALVAAVLLALMPSLTHAQDKSSSSTQVNQAIDAAERICLVGNRFKFQVDASGNLTISKLGAATNITVDRADAKGSQFFENEEIRRLVDQDIRGCMKGQWAAILPYLAGLTPPPSPQQVAQKLPGSYQVHLGPIGGCNGGAPNSLPGQLARIDSIGGQLIAYNECGTKTTATISVDGKILYFYNLPAQIDLNANEVKITDTTHGNWWEKVVH